MGKLIGRLLLSMLMVFLITHGTTAISVLDNFHSEKWNTYHDEKGSIDIGGKSFTMKYSGLCVRGDSQIIPPLTQENGVSISDGLTQYRLMRYEGNTPKESVSHMQEPATSF